MRSDPIDISSIIVRTLFLALTVGFLGLVLYGVVLLAAPFGIAFILALALNPLVRLIERFGFSRTVATLLLFLVVGVLLYGLTALAIGPITEQIQTMMDEYELYEGRAKIALGRALFLVNDFAGPYLSATGTDLSVVLQGFFAPFRDSARGLVARIPDLLTYLLVTPIITVIFLLQGDEIYKNLLGMVPNRYFEMTLLLVKRGKEQILSYLVGLFWQWVILAAILVPGLMIIRLPYGALAAVLAASLNVIPYLGPLLGLGPALLLAAISPGGTALLPWVLLVFLIAQLVDNVFTQPVVLAKSVQIHPLISILAIIAALSTQSIALVMVAIPVTGITMVAIQVMYRQLKSFRML